MPEPWASIVTGLTGPYGVIFAQSIVIYFLWRLFRESDRRLDGLTEAVRDLTTELRESGGARRSRSR